MKKIFSLTILCVFIGSLNLSAEPVEQLLEAFNHTYRVDQANRFFKELLKQEFVDEPVAFAASTPKDSLQQQVWYWAAEWFYDQQQYQQAVSYAQQALPLYHVEDQKADCLNLLAVVNIRLANYEEAAEYAKQCYALDEKSGDADRMSSSLNTLAAIYMGAAQPKEAETYVLKGIEKAQQANNPGRMAVLQAMASKSGILTVRLMTSTTAPTALSRTMRSSPTSGFPLSIASCCPSSFAGKSPLISMAKTS